MLLCFDIGNTNIKIGLFDGDQLCCHWRVATDRTRLADEYAMLLFNLLKAGEIKREEITGCVLSSVVPVLTQEFGELARRFLQIDPLVVHAGMNTGIEVHTDLPSEVGADLIAGAVAARALFGTPVIIIGFGTATTFVAVSPAGHFEGVAIAPGVITGADSLFKAAAVLPQIALAQPSVAIGKNTIQSMQAGIVYGFAALVTGIVERFQREIGQPAAVVATGGLASLIADETPVIQHVEPNLNLIGLRLIYERNRAAVS
jgi:type III pantothenate kinase